MSKKAFGGVGHGGKDPGACGNGLKEANINLDCALAWEKEMQRHGVEVKLSRYKDENDDLNEEIRECNDFNPDIAVDFHTNSGGGDGFEVFVSVVGSNSRKLGTLIEKEVVKTGQNSRGVKTKKRDDGRDYFGFIRQTVCPAVITECAFIDNAKDIAYIDTKAEAERYAKAVAKACLEYLGIAYKEENKSSTPPSNNNGQMLAVCIGAFKVREYAEAALKEAKEKGFKDAYLITR
ncbi:N-acetylmuramoyl-L-alanine amidase family protein [Paraclostridium sordellii]|uniref:N-acetylmuramoyl-L-alanine amidase family protein n=1 Tax=Paraclostridium sordellii TaxID=1505 RepID=UPI0005E0AF79|nr:N-acetylmuramoyl-L-alanine amidase [Paeniclostridium sordellii]CEN81007.1 cell wall hydrolase/autolysin [[Clostridium] sordellii] [Paeniclostridium sordellii]